MAAGPLSPCGPADTSLLHMSLYLFHYTGAMTTQPPGPARVEATGPLPAARARVAAALAELGPGVPLTTLADRLGGHPNATRAHLDALLEAGFAAAAPLPRSGRGRPALGYTLTRPGAAALRGDPAVSAYVELVSALAAHLDAAPDAAEQARAIGREWGAHKAETPSPDAAVQLLDDLGFSPTVSGRTIRLHTCPLLDAAQEHPEVVCAIHAGLVQATSGDADAELAPFAEPGACCVHLSR